MQSDAVNSASLIDRTQARTIIESLADGVVPRHGVSFFTAGRAKWLKSLSEDLDDLSDARARDGRVRVFNGRNGDGKTHLMHLLQDLALHKGFAVSYVVISDAVPLYKWDRVYGAVGRSLGTRAQPDGPGLRAVINPLSPDPQIAADFMQKASSVRTIPGVDPNFATAVYRYCTQQTVNMDYAQDLLLLGAWLEGQPQRLKEMGISGTVDVTNGVRMLRSLVKVLRHFGFAGLVILVDEVESILNLPRNRRRDSYQTLRLLIDRENTPSHTMLVASTTPPMFTDRERGMATYPALWSRLHQSHQTDFVNYNATLVDLVRTPLTENDYVDIGTSIREIHKSAREWQPNDRITDEFISEAASIAASGRLTLTYSTTRVFVKLIVENLELAFQHDAFKPPTVINEMFGDVDGRLVEAEKTKHNASVSAE